MACVMRVATAALGVVLACTAAPAQMSQSPAVSSAAATVATTPIAAASRESPGPILGETALWEQVRARMPGGTPIAVPTWLPAGIDRERVELRELRADATDPRYTVIYTSTRGPIVFGLGPATDVTGSGIGTLVRNSSATLTFPPQLFNDPGGRGDRRVRWTERGRILRIDSSVYSGDDLLHVAWSLDRAGAPAPPYPYSRTKIGACAKAGGAPEDTVRGYIELLSSNDPDAIADCTALERLGASSARQQPTLPRTVDIAVRRVGEVGGRIQVAGSWTFVSDPGGPWSPQPTLFFTMGLEDGRWRIFEAGTAAYAPPP